MPADGPTSRLHVVSPRGAGADATPSTLSSSESCQALFEAHLPVIRGVVRFVCHRQRLDPTQAEDFESEVMLRLVEDDYDVLRRFQARSSLRTYLTVVVQRLGPLLRLGNWMRGKLTGPLFGICSTSIFQSFSST